MDMFAVAFELCGWWTGMKLGSAMIVFSETLAVFGRPVHWVFRLLEFSGGEFHLMLTQD